MDDSFRFDTLAVHAGPAEPVSPLEAFETRLAALEGAGLPGGGAWSLGFTSGRAAVDAVARLLRPGDRVVLSEELSVRALDVLLPLMEFGIELEFRDLTDPSRWRFRNTSLVWLETPGTATLGVINLSSVANRAHDAGALVVVDNSMATPLITRPLEFGVDVVVYSGVGSLVGQSGVRVGAISGREETLRDRLSAVRDLVASRPDAVSLEVALCGLSTLSVRLEHQSNLALKFARRLVGTAGVRRVYYPGLESHRGHTIAAEQMCARDGRELFGPALSVRLESADMATLLPGLTHLWRDSNNLGGARSSLTQPAAQVSGLGLPADVVRFSVGLEDENDLWQDLEQALNTAREAQPAASSAETPAPEVTDLETVPEPEPIPEPAPEVVVAAEPDEPTGPARPFEPASKDPISNLGVTELDRYARLREWRDAEAERLEISRFQIASNAVLSMVARENPVSFEGLSALSGLGADRSDRFGAAMLAVLRGETPAPVDLSPRGTPSIPSVPASDVSASSAPVPSPVAVLEAVQETVSPESITPTPSKTARFDSENTVQDKKKPAKPRRGRPRAAKPDVSSTEADPVPTSQADPAPSSDPVLALPPTQTVTDAAPADPVVPKPRRGRPRKTPEPS
jgi:cystathionine gamma-synthase